MKIGKKCLLQLQQDQISNWNLKVWYFIWGKVVNDIEKKINDFTYKSKNFRRQYIYEIEKSISFPETHAISNSENTICVSSDSHSAIW